jgi:hypothetical protein
MARVAPGLRPGASPPPSPSRGNTFLSSSNKVMPLDDMGEHRLSSSEAPNPAMLVTLPSSPQHSITITSFDVNDRQPSVEPPPIVADHNAEAKSLRRVSGVARRSTLENLSLEPPSPFAQSAPDQGLQLQASASAPTLLPQHREPPAVEGRKPQLPPLQHPHATSPLSQPPPQQQREIGLPPESHHHPQQPQPQPQEVEATGEDGARTSLTLTIPSVHGADVAVAERHPARDRRDPWVPQEEGASGLPTAGSSTAMDAARGPKSEVVGSGVEGERVPDGGHVQGA